jgi:hypothetical protein
MCFQSLPERSAPIARTVYIYISHSKVVRWNDNPAHNQREPFIHAALQALRELPNRCPLHVPRSVTM